MPGSYVIEPADHAWQLQARCIGMDPAVFFGTTPGETAEAKRFCHDCPVEADCLEYALVNNIEHGVWGGTSERGRKRLRRQRRSAA